MSQQEHPFAPFIRILGKGKNGSRALTQEEAHQAMRMILNDEVEPEQLGAFLMLMRVKEESPEELAGFVAATRECLELPDTQLQVDLDWSSYAGKRRHLPWFLLSALLLAESGVRIFMHGASGHTAGRIYTKDVLGHFGMTPCNSIADAIDKMEQNNFAYLDLEQLSPKLHQIIELRPVLGLRSPVHTLSRLLNPFKAPYVLQGIFHPGYRPMHQEAAILLEQPHLAVIKGEGGEIERNPDIACLVQSVHDGEMSDEEWPPMFKRRHVKDADLNLDQLAALWNGTHEDEYAEASVVGTVAITLKMMGRADSIESAEAAAREMWENRNRERYGAAA
ncbi:glycosyl transferase [Solemya pervernicosa gill symbiont]|uniref:Glycosyl transferase n=2 Tax=Gammaproteobacteria incertae sedis TaxID=118884 RepID=A0A1T2L6L2_9GAMM|nr:glycosyl transferase family protein [Candidatus Reidiella endopervernicosa]OOZ40690.1 glycosyl transferase [Solemya pervernicosa gill symbiont]QKQ26754.1 glycosyl transferase family protein [Candidatus Reidiella endopervernicosa]